MKRQYIASVCLLMMAFPCLADASAEGDAGRGQKSFSKCSACHNIESPRTRMGPHLMGVVGRVAGSVADYKYSQAMKNAGASGLTWDEAELRKFLASPKKVVPGTSMRFFGLWSESEIEDLIAYMKTVPAQK